MQRLQLGELQQHPTQDHGRGGHGPHATPTARTPALAAIYLRARGYVVPTPTMQVLLSEGMGERVRL